MAVTITRTAWTDDDGSGTVGTVINNAEKTTLYGQIDTALAALPVNGTSLTAHGVLVGNGTSAVAVTAAGTTGQTLTSNGAAADPTFQYQGSNAVCDVRLTLTTATPVTTADVTSAANIFITPYKGNRIALYNGSTVWTVLTFTEITQALGTLVNGQAYDLFAFNNAGAVATEILEWSNATVTVTIAAPGVVSWTAHGMSTGMTFIFTTSGALPTGLAANTVYFVTVVDANSFKLSTTLANVASATFITTTGTQSGTHTGHSPNSRQTALVLQDGVLVKSGTTTRRYLGTFLATSTTTTEDSFAKRFVWNYYNRAKRPLRVTEATASWTYTLATLRQANASATNQVACVVGVAEVPLEVEVAASTSNTVPANATVSIGEDSTNTGVAAVVNQATSPGASSGTFYGPRAALRRFPSIGYHAYVWLEYSTASGTTTWYGVSAPFVQSGISGTIEG